LIDQIAIFCAVCDGLLKAASPMSPTLKTRKPVGKDGLQDTVVTFVPFAVSIVAGFFGAQNPFMFPFTIWTVLIKPLVTYSTFRWTSCERFTNSSLFGVCGSGLNPSCTNRR